MIAIKLFLVQGEDIVASDTQYDALWYVRSASHWYWGAAYDWNAFIRPCTYPLWIAGVSFFHLPLRLAIELAQLGGALFLIYALRTLEVGRWSCALAFAFIALHPVSFQLNDYTMSDTLYGALLWWVLGGLLLILRRPGLWVSIATGVGFAALWNTREEAVLLVALVAIWSACFLWCEWPAPSVGLLRKLKPVALMVGTAAALILAAYSMNNFVFHSFARSEMTAPVFQSFFHSLLRIQPARPKPYAPITMDTLHSAFAVSPTLAKLRPQLDGPIGEAWRIETVRRVGTPGEIGAGWIVWATRQAASTQGVFDSPRKARRFFQKATREINHARAEGRLPARFALDGFLDPFTQSGGLSRLLPSARRVTGRVFARWEPGAINDDPNLTSAEVSLYDDMTLRRGAGVRARDGLAAFLEQSIGRYHWIAMLLLHFVAIGSGLSLLFPRWRGKISRRFVSTIAVLASAIFLRLLLFSWLDATAFDGTQDRFLFPILPLWSALLLLIIFSPFSSRTS